MTRAKIIMAEPEPAQTMLIEPAATDCPEWYRPLLSIVSKGSQVDVVGGLAGTHAARQEHQGQFFTPPEVVRAMWALAGELKPHDDRQPITVLDNSFGSGRMFMFANPAQHKLCGIEADSDLAARVRHEAALAGFEFILVAGQLQHHRLHGDECDLALINPPFSLHWDDELVENYACNAFGRFGPRSSAISHRYATRQALEWARHVVALLPRTFADTLAGDDEFSRGLKAIYHLPKYTFRSEGAEVATSIAVWENPWRWDHEDSPPTITTLTSLDEVEPILDIESRYRSHQLPDLVRATEDPSTPAVTIPVTGSKLVRVCHDGRRLTLKFQCGVAQARVMNKVLKERVSRYVSKGFRRARGVEFVGQGAFDLENYLAQTDPIAALAEFTGTIKKLGFNPEVDPAVIRYLRRKARKHTIRMAPLRHAVNLHDGGLSRWLGGQQMVRGIVKQEFTLSEPYWGTFSERTEAKVGETYTLQTTNPRWNDDARERYWKIIGRGVVEKEIEDRYRKVMRESDLIEHFNFPDFTPLPNDWTVVHEGLASKFPHEVEQMRQRATKLGLHKWCTWDYQFDDLCEIAVKRGGVIVGWDMGLGKARLAAALCLLGGGQHNLIVVEAHLVKEMETELKKIKLAKSKWQTITKPEHLQDLKQVNVISYNRLKAAVNAQASKRITYARRLRRRIHTMVCDEAQLLRNPKTDQSQAVWMVSPKVRVALSGTPVANYCRDVLGLIQWVAGDGTASQPFGMHRPYMRPQNLASMNDAPRGVDVFREMFVVLEWVTNEFNEDLRNGAKREVPKIKDVHGFRRLLAPVLKRRVKEEPDVAKWVKTPQAVYRTTEVEWDHDHLIYYYRTAKEFVDWFKSLNQYEIKHIGLIAILAKMQAVFTAGNYPQKGVGNLGPYPAQTSKQREVIKRIRRLTADGHKTICFCHSPEVVEWLSSHLPEIDHVKFHGGVSINQRIKEMDDRFRYGPAPLLLATKGTLQTGYNIHQADRVLLYDRSWTPKVEQQAIARTLRPQQEKQVVVEYLHLPGSIDDYQAQMVSMKADAMRAGLDFGAEDDERDFLHIETILGRFVKDFEEKFGLRLQNVGKGA